MIQSGQSAAHAGNTAHSAKKLKPAKTPRTRKPEHMSLEEWQVALRREFGREQKFKLKNVGSEPVCSEFHVSNPESGRSYRVAIRGQALGENYCSCPDFAINTLGTCKHIEFTLAKLENKRGGAAALKAGLHASYSEVFLRYGARREVVFRPGAAAPLSLRAFAAVFFDSSGILRPDAFDKFEDFVKRATALDGGLRCYDDALEFVAQVRDRARLVRKIDALFPKGTESAAFSALLKVPLYNYQRAGALFAARAGRALIADDMGLGKTIQAIAAVEVFARAAGVERVLVVTPTSLKHQWKSEVQKFTGRSVEVIEGMQASRSRKYATASFYKIANYDVLHRDSEAIARWAPDVIILDEAQRIKNWKTRAAQTVKRMASPFAIVLTGTPLENRLEELHSIVEFVDRFRLGPSFRFLAEHQHVNEHGRVIGYRNLDKISETLRPILLRRNKREVLKELPARTDKHYFLPMTPQQLNFHDENGEIVAGLVHKWKSRGFLTDAEQKRLTCALQNMRMSCNSTYLLDHETDYGVKADEIVTLLGEWLERPDAKAVVFSQWVRSHELLAGRLKKRGIDFVLFHGGVPGPKRKDLIARFRDDPRCRVFLSTDAGGVGLNLQFASLVVNMDQPWNPAILEQRVGRVHRLGQRNPVNVAHFVSEGTIEHGMLDLLKFKKSLLAGVLDGGEREIFLGGTKLKKFMDSVEKATGAIPAQTPDSVISVHDIGEMDIPAGAQTAAEEIEPAPRQTAQTAEGLADLLNAGRALLEGLAQALKPNGAAQNGSSALIERDAKTGQAYLKLPMPSSETLVKITSFLSGLIAGK
ncbi:MAG TPA: DEAD/DEAH box helicase [Planctomycetota bacterium]|nr:DEAD/DEAH box helicase [Planctomycetota bacterium]